VTSTELTFPPVYSLSVPEQTTPQLTNFDLTGFAYEWAIAGQPFLGVASDEFPLIRAFTAVSKEQFDNSRDPGEQSLTGWWLRSQRDFSGGAGITYLEPPDDERIMSRFKSSQGIDVWTPGLMKLLPTVREAFTSSGLAKVAGARDEANNTCYVFGTDGAGGVKKWQGTTATAITGWTDNVEYLASYGSGVFGFHDDGVDYADASGTTATSLWTHTKNDSGRGWWVKQRLVAAWSNVLYELGGFVGGNLPTALYTHPQSDWVWTGACESPGAILVAGHAGALSTIYKFTVDETDGTLPSLTSAVTVAEMPVGEIILGIFSYLGSYIVIMTNVGVRVGLLGADGSVNYGPLTYTGATKGYAAGFDRFVYVGVDDVGSGNAGVIRIDLSNSDDEGRFAWAADLDTGETGTIGGVAMLGCTGRVCIGVDSAGVYEQHPTDLVDSGYMYTGQVRYSTLEDKSFRFFNLKRSFVGGTVNVKSVQIGGTEDDLYTYTDGSPNVEVQVTPFLPVESLGLKISLTRSASDSTSGPEISGWQFKALPAVARKQRWRLPLLCFDEVMDRFGNRAGGPGFAYKQYGDLKTALLSGVPVTLQDFMAKESYTVLIEDIQLTQTSPPRGSSGLGGVLIVTCREL
jgi:hypothetical protein